MENLVGGCKLYLLVWDLLLDVINDWKQKVIGSNIYIYIWKLDGFKQPGVRL